MAASPYHPLFTVERKKLMLCPIHMPETARTLAEAFISNRTEEPLVRTCGCHCTLDNPLRLAPFAATQAIPRNKRSSRQYSAQRFNFSLRRHVLDGNQDNSVWQKISLCRTMAKGSVCP